MRLLLSKNSREKLFNHLKKEGRLKTLKDLSQDVNIPLGTLKNWKYGKRYLPDNIVPKKLNLQILDKKEDNWGSSLGGKKSAGKGLLILKERLGEEGYREFRRKAGRKGGRKAIKNLWKNYTKEEIRVKAIKGRIDKRKRESKYLEEKYSKFFTNNKICLNINKVNYSKKDERKKIKLPKEVTKELAEEIGIHSGDGCLSYKKNYYSVKCSKKEEVYITKFLFPLINRLYNINPKLMRLSSVSGFEIYSKVLCEFKNKVIGLPYGEKKDKIEIPKVVLKTRNKEIYRAFIRGVFDTDGCICLTKGKRDYPTISILISSRKFILELKNMLEKLGFIPKVYNYTLILTGPTMIEKWINEIGSNNKKHLEKFKRAKNLCLKWKDMGV